jgi:uncharacterized protein YutE (UPF0331/DUF86 family)
MPNKDLVFKKLAEIVKQLQFLKKLSTLSQNELFQNEETLYFAERVMERLIGAALDINMHLCSYFGKEVPADYHESFLALARLGVFPLEFAKEIARSSALRNILVHEYQALDLEKFHSALGLALKQYPHYVTGVTEFIEENSSGMG